MDRRGRGAGLGVRAVRESALPQIGDEGISGQRPIQASSVSPSRPLGVAVPAMKPTSSSGSRRRVSAEDALALWREYKATGDLQVRNRLVMTYAPLVKYIVFKKVRELPARCEVEDFISCGLEALIASIDRYDPEKGATLEQFAWTRIHGAVLDELRRQDWAPRSLRRWERDIAKARDQFTTHPRPPPDARGARRRALDLRRGPAPPRGRHRRLGRHVAQHARDLRRRDHRRAHRHARRRRHAASTRSTRPPTPRPRTKFRRAFDTLPAARARGRRPALREEPDAARDRRGPGRLREPHLPDPLAAQAHAQAAAVPTTRCCSPPSAEVRPQAQLRAPTTGLR